MNAHEPDVVRWLLLVGATLPGAVLAGPACPVCPSPAGGSGGPDARRGSAGIPDEGTVMTAGPRAVILARDG
jgi:hypothetical protein